MEKDKKSREELDKELMELLHPNPWAEADRAEEEGRWLSWDR